jgi:putative FmdB family regulatory protein
MPTYQYKCSKCGEVFEAFQKMSDLPIEDCPHCQGKVERIISGGAGFLLKGSGFYATDYRSSEYKKAAAADISKPEIITPKTDTKKA